MNNDLLPYGMSLEEFDNCKRIVFEITRKEDVEELALKIANITYAKGGDYSTETLTEFAKSYIDM